MTLDFDAKAGRACGDSGGVRRLGDDFNGVHRLGIHPLHMPGAGMTAKIRRFLVPNKPAGLFMVPASFECWFAFASPVLIDSHRLNQFSVGSKIPG
jgi:hypothetical protein